MYGNLIGTIDKIHGAVDEASSPPKHTNKIVKTYELLKSAAASNIPPTIPLKGRSADYSCYLTDLYGDVGKKDNYNREPFGHYLFVLSTFCMRRSFLAW